MKLDDILEAPPEVRARAASASGGTITIAGRNGIRISIPMSDALDPVTGLLDRRFWGESGRRVDSHLGAVED